MDPYIDAGKLDPGHPLHAAKVDNFRRGDRAHCERREEVDALPVKLTLQTTDTCNLDCPHCQIPRAQKVPRMEAAVFERVVAELFSTPIELHPTNLGEPLTWPLFERLCAEMDRHGVRLDLTTNGTLLQGARLDWIAPIARDVKVSFDGATPEAFERFRRGARFTSVCANVEALVAHLVQARRGATVSLQMTLMRANYRELPALVRLAADLGARRVKAYHLFSFTPAMDAESLMPMLDVWPPVFQEALGEPCPDGLCLPDVPLGRGEIDVPRARHDLERVVASDRHPSDPRRAEVVPREPFPRGVVGEQRRPRDAHLLEDAAQGSREVAIVR